MAKRGLQFEISFRDRDVPDAPKFRDLEITSVKRLCPICGDWKSEAIDVCWDPDVRCKREDS
jgi:hypothetical protein